MGLFDKKYCDICGEKIGFLGNCKLEDAKEILEAQPVEEPEASQE